MDRGRAAILESVELDKVTVPGGDPGEQLVAHLIMSVIASELYSDAIARAYVEQAQALAVALAVQSSIYRPPRPSKFACLTCEHDGETESILVSVINGVPVVPPISVGKFANVRRPAAALNVTDLEIVHFMLRLRPRRLATVLESLAGMASSQQRTDTIRHAVAACMRHALPPGEPLDRVSDYFALAHNLIGTGNFPLAALTLSNADSALDAYAQTQSPETHAEIVRSMREQIRRLLTELKQKAM
jgi:hypothetical protein